MEERTRRSISSMKRPRILLGVTGSVAAVKSPELASCLARHLCADVCVLLSKGGENFWKKAKEYNPKSWDDFMQLLSRKKYSDVESATRSGVGNSPGSIMVHTADDEWKGWNRLGDPVLHIDLRDWADLAIVAPLSAHTLAKIAAGLSDDTLSCCIRAWDFGHGVRSGKPLILAPAMNTAMWEHPLTKSQLDTVQSFWNESRDRRNQVCVVEPQIKKLACGEIGTGALAPLQDIEKVVKGVLSAIGFNLPSNGNISKVRSEKKERVRAALISYAKEQFQEQKNLGAREAVPEDCPKNAELVAPVSPTPDELIQLVLPKLGLSSDSTLIDLGCGDGRWIVEASLNSACKCVGCDIDAERLLLATKRIANNYLAERVQVIQSDVFQLARSDLLDKADVIIMYLFREAMAEMSVILRGKRSSGKLKSGTMVVSVGFRLPEFVPKWDAECRGIHVYLYRM